MALAAVFATRLKRAASFKRHGFLIPFCCQSFSLQAYSHFLIEPDFDLPLVSSFFNTGSSFILDDLIDADIQDIRYAC